ncbi:DUF413 domain-containing protein [Pseudoalteromonas tunicata]|jgi:hypothetical protein|uniref:Macrodomain Ori protein n=1 Tax=Pseudoalteromonas tunicata D2 TaxID=87626 RepID=A4C568_9GAMM|nr:DUF413 domain-containing protein [Pseudoalteromonas tunicata]ATC96826.1 hypothetical protein PTUN_b0438 [Pseudoalteromonas tunicata]AXT32969.1 hypothetical protein D1819_19220 [Pseudoalteromonas tunicata]EAR30700.1 hypothetical protein PTD2_03986 [Pseudoalteromonas tunicata D2]
MKDIFRLIRNFILGQAVLALMALFFAIPIILYVTVFSLFIPDWAAGITIILLIIGFTVTLEKIGNFKSRTKSKPQNIPDFGVSSMEEAHKNLIKKGFQVDPQIAKSLNRANIAHLEKYGAWLSALETGQIAPITEEQNRFLDVCRGFQNPINATEIAWYNYKKVASRLAGGDFGYHKNSFKIEKVGVKKM